MFTGIIEHVGTIHGVQRDGAGLELRIAAPWTDLKAGESIAVDGACLTVASQGAEWFGVHVVDTTLDRTLFGTYAPGRAVNLERALRVGDRVGGHFVEGHVDGVGDVLGVTDRRDARIVDLEVPPAMARLTVPMGAVTVDGVSLTVIDVPGPNQIRISLIPFTLQHTTLSRLAPGERVHLEGDSLTRRVAGMRDPGYGISGPANQENR